MKALSILSGVVDGEVDAPYNLKLDPGPDLLSIRSAKIASGTWPVIGRIEVYVERVEVRARCYFNSTMEFLNSLRDLAGRPVIKFGSGLFVGLVKIDAMGRAGVFIDDRALPLVSVQVEIDPDKPVRANVVLYFDPDDPHAWSPDLAVLLLEACGWVLGEAEIREVNP